MSQYQRQYQQKMQQEEMARKQQHEDTYLKMAENAENKSLQMANAKFLRDLSENFDEDEIPEEMRDQYREDWVRRGAMETDMDEGQLRSILPRGKSVKKWSGAPLAPDSKLTEEYIPAVGGARLITKKAERMKAEKLAAEMKFKEQQEAAKEAAAKAAREHEFEKQSRMFGHGMTMQQNQFNQQMTMAQRQEAARAAREGAKKSDNPLEMSEGEQRGWKHERDIADRDTKLAAVDTAFERWQNAATDLEKHPGLPRVTGYLQGRFESLDLTPEAREARAKQKNLDAMGINNIIMELKSQSKTGATGYGALSKIEFESLQNAAADLAKTQDPGSYRAALKSLVTRLDAARAKIREARAENASFSRVKKPGAGAAPAGGNKLQEDIAALKAAGATDAEILAALGKR
jgi:hypothetical protein